MKENILQHFKVVKQSGNSQYQCICPAHDDKKESLSIKIAEDKILLHCHAGCSTVHILEKIGLTLADLFTDKNYNIPTSWKDKIKVWVNHDRSKLKLEDIYPYTDMEGNVLYYKLRYEGKEIRHCKVENNNVIFKGVTKEIEKQLYNNIVFKTLKEGDRIYIVEGEKDVHTLTRLDMPAVTPGGVKDWREDFAELFKGLDVVILQDNDDPGRQFASQVKRDLEKYAAKCKIVTTSRLEHGDVTDYIEKEGHTKQELIDLIENEKNVPTDQEQQSDYIYNSNGMKLKVYENLKVLLDKHNINVALNELSREIKMQGEINVPNSYDSSITKLNTLCQMEELKLTKDQLYDFMYCIAYDNKFNSVITYLNRCKEQYLQEKPQEPIINQLFKTLYYAPGEDAEFFNRILLKWLLCCVHIAYNEGFNFIDFMPILKGKQGIGKTAWIASLFPREYLNEFFKDGVMLKLKDKDSLIENTKYWVVELGEFGKSLKENDRDEIKAFLGKKLDEFRPPYARSARKHPRHTAFIGTINDSEFLRDTTGNRRYVVYDLVKIDYQHNININLLWGEIALLYEDKKCLTYLTPEEQEKNEQHNESYMVRSTEQIIIEEMIPFNQPMEQWKPITSMAIAEYIEKETGRRLEPRRIGKALSAIGIKQEYTRIGGKMGRYYILPYIRDFSMPI